MIGHPAVAKSRAIEVPGGDDPAVFGSEFADLLDLGNLFAAGPLAVDNLFEVFDVSIDVETGTVTLNAKDNSLRVEVRIQGDELQTFIDAKGVGGSAEIQAALLARMVQSVAG